MQAIGCLLIGFVVVVLAVLSILLLAIQHILQWFGIRFPLLEWVTKRFMKYQTFYGNGHPFSGNNASSGSYTAPENKKIFTEEEGDYVDFEEIKE